MTPGVTDQLQSQSQSKAQVQSQSQSKSRHGALKREILALEKGNAELRTEVEAARSLLNFETLCRVQADKHCEEEQATLLQLRKGLALARKHLARHEDEAQKLEESIMQSRSIISDAALYSSMAEMSQEPGSAQTTSVSQTQTKSHQVTSTSLSSPSGSTRPTPRRPGRRRSPTSGAAGRHGPGSSEVAGPSVEQSSGLENLKEKLSFVEPSVESLKHIRNTNEHFASAVDEMAELSRTLTQTSQDVSVPTAAKPGGASQGSWKEGAGYGPVLMRRPHPDDVRKYLF